MANVAKALESLKVSLTEAIDEWMDQNCESDSWELLNIWVGPDMSRCMSSAAMAVLAGAIDTTNIIRENGEVPVS